MAKAVVSASKVSRPKAPPRRRISPLPALPGFGGTGSGGGAGSFSSM
jgi:hypothetical protein